MQHFTELFNFSLCCHYHYCRNSLFENSCAILSPDSSGKFLTFFFFNIKRHFSCVDVSKNRLLFKIAILLKLVLLLLAKVVRLNAF